MHINVKSGVDRDPFDQSDRDPIGPNAGKGDRDRSNLRVFKRQFPSLLGRGVGKRPGKTVYRYPRS